MIFLFWQGGQAKNHGLSCDYFPSNIKLLVAECTHGMHMQAMALVNAPTDSIEEAKTVGAHDVAWTAVLLH